MTSRAERAARTGLSDNTVTIAVIGVILLVLVVL
jgi:hypothetical protein